METPAPCRRLALEAKALAWHGIPGGQAAYVRVPYADVGPLKVESDLKDLQLLFLSDIYPTGYMAAANCDTDAGGTVAVWGCGPVGQFAIRSAWMLGAGDPEYQRRDSDSSEPNRPTALNQMIQSCRKGGQLSIPGVYTDSVDGVAFNGLMNKGLSPKSGQTHMQAYMPSLLHTIELGNIDPSFIIMHRYDLGDVAKAYADFNTKQDGCIKVVMTP